MKLIIFWTWVSARTLRGYFPQFLRRDKRFYSLPQYLKRSGSFSCIFVLVYVLGFDLSFNGVKVRQMCLVALRRDHEFINCVHEGTGETHQQVRQTHMIASLDKHFSLLYTLLRAHIADNVDYKVHKSSSAPVLIPHDMFFSFWLTLWLVPEGHCLLYNCYGYKTSG